MFSIEAFSVEPNSCIPHLLKQLLRKMNVSTEEDMRPDGSESSSASHVDVNGTHRESKLELFGFDSLVNILGLRRNITLVGLRRLLEEDLAINSSKTADYHSIYAIKGRYGVINFAGIRFYHQHFDTLLAKGKQYYVSLCR